METDDIDKIFLDKEKQEFRGISRELLNQWELNYPWIHVSTELRKCAYWLCIGTRSHNVNRLAHFIEYWFKIAQGGKPVKYQSFKRKGCSTHIRDVVHDVMKDMKPEEGE